MKIFQRLANKLIDHALKHPYRHLTHEDGKPHMSRYWLIKPRSWLALSVRIHHIHSSDRGRDMHDHPWASLSLILRGGYWELMPDQVAWRDVGGWIWHGACDRHRLLVPKKTSCWSLFIMFEKTQEWGFHTRQGWVHHEDYLRKHKRAPARDSYDNG